MTVDSVSTHQESAAQWHAAVQLADCKGHATVAQCLSLLPHAADLGNSLTFHDVLLMQACFAGTHSVVTGAMFWGVNGIGLSLVSRQLSEAMQLISGTVEPLLQHKS